MAEQRAIRNSRSLSEQMADNEFEIEIANQMGPFGRRAIDASKAEVIGSRSYNLRGMRTGDNITQAAIDRYAVIFDGTGKELTADTVYAVSHRDATLPLWGHEFRHRAISLGGDLPIIEDMGMDNRRNNEERFNTLFDAWRASTPTAWREAVNKWRLKKYAGDA